MLHGLATTAQIRMQHLVDQPVTADDRYHVLRTDDSGKTLASVNRLLRGFDLPPVVIDDSVTGNCVGWMPG